MLAFCFSVYQDTDLAKRLIQQLRYFYTSAEILCLSDGKVDKDFILFCQSNQIIFQANSRLKLQIHGAAYVIRLLKVILGKTTSKNIVLLDPDSFILRDFNYLPDADVAGSIISVNKYKHIQGGCIFFKREAVKKILESELLNNIKYLYDRRFSYQRFNQENIASGEIPSEEWLIAEDQILSDCIWQLNLKVAEWEEVYCRFREACPDPDKYAVIHPVKSLLSPCINQ